jgi:hypothetical protein
VRALIDRARGTAAHRLWRSLGERSQLRSFAARVEDLARAPADADGLTRTLAGRAEHRRPVDEQRDVVALGARDWEDRGLWQALGRWGELDLFDYSGVVRGRRPSRALRRELTGEFLRFVEARPRPPALAFVYAAGLLVEPELLRELARRGSWVVLMGLDDKHQMPGPRVGDLEGWQLEAARACDVYWTTWRAGVDWLASRGVPAWYAAEAADPRLFAPGRGPRDVPVLWVGGAYGPRRDLVRWLRGRGIRVDAYGPGWPEGPVSFDRMLELYGRAEVVLGMSGVRQSDRVKHLKGRDFEVPMSGCAYLTSYNAELTDHFEVGREILCYSSFEECGETLAWLLKRPQQLEAVRIAARARCLRDHTWDHRIASLVALLARAQGASRRPAEGGA